MNIRAGMTEKLQVEQDHDKTRAERVKEKAYPGKTAKGTHNCQGLQMS